MDAITLLRSEHAWLRKTFKTISRGNQTLAARMKMFEHLMNFLKTHEKMEQKVWYPYLIKFHPPLARRIYVLIEEEKKAAIDLQRFKYLDPSGEAWWSHFDKLYASVDYHAGKEETNLFPRVRQLVPKNQLLILGKNMRQFKQN